MKLAYTSAIAFLAVSLVGVDADAIVSAQPSVQVRCEHTVRSTSLPADCAGTWTHCPNPSGTPVSNCCDHIHTAVAFDQCVTVGSTTTKKWGGSTPKKRQFQNQDCEMDAAGGLTGNCKVVPNADCDHLYYAETCANCST